MIDVNTIRAKMAQEPELNYFEHERRLGYFFATPAIVDGRERADILDNTVWLINEGCYNILAKRHLKDKAPLAKSFTIYLPAAGICCKYEKTPLGGGFLYTHTFLRKKADASNSF